MTKHGKASSQSRGFEQSQFLDLQAKAQRLIASVGVDEGKETNPGSVEFLLIADG